MKYSRIVLLLFIFLIACVSAFDDEDKSALSRLVEKIIKDREINQTLEEAKWKCLEKIGAGADADVFLVEFDDKKYALKIFKDSSCIIKKNQTEWDILNKCKHLTIPIVYEKESNYILMDYKEGKELGVFIEDKKMDKTFNWDDFTKRFINQAFDILYYLHQHAKIIHKDLSLRNFLIQEYESLCLIDFGSSSEFSYYKDSSGCSLEDAKDNDFLTLLNIVRFNLLDHISPELKAKLNLDDLYKEWVDKSRYYNSIRMKMLQL